MAIDEVLNRIETKVINEQFWNKRRRIAVAEDSSLLRWLQIEAETKKHISEIKKWIAIELQALPPDEEIEREAKQLFIRNLLSRGFPLPAAALADIGQPRHLHKINEQQAVCLWLYGFRKHLSFDAGLWQMFIDIRDDSGEEEDASPPPELPELIRKFFYPNGVMTEELSDEDIRENYLDEVLKEAASYALRLEESTNKTKIIAWVIETKMKGRAPNEVAEELRQRKSKAVSSVDINILRAENTLMDKYVKEVCDAIDKL